MTFKLLTNFLTLVLFASGVRGMSESDCIGSYGFTAQGFIITPSAEIPAVSVGLIKLSSGGTCAFEVALNAGGTFTPSTPSVSCTWNIQSSGLGFIDINLGPGVDIPLAFVAVLDGQEIRFSRADAGVATGVAKRITTGGGGSSSSSSSDD